VEQTPHFGIVRTFVDSKRDTMNGPLDEVREKPGEAQHSPEHSGIALT